MDIISDRIDDIKDSEFDKAEVEKAFAILNNYNFNFVAMSKPKEGLSFAMASNCPDSSVALTLFTGLTALSEELGTREKIDKSEMFLRHCSVLCSVFGIGFNVVADALKDAVKKGDFSEQVRDSSIFS